MADLVPSFEGRPGDPEVWAVAWVGFSGELFPSAKPVAFGFPPFGWYRRVCAAAFGWLPSDCDGERLGDVERMVDTLLKRAQEASKD